MPTARGGAPKSTPPARVRLPHDRSLDARGSEGPRPSASSQLALLSYEQAIVIRDRCAPYFSRLEDLSGVQERLRAAGEGPSRRRPMLRRANEYRKIA